MKTTKKLPLLLALYALFVLLAIPAIAEGILGQVDPALVFAPETTLTVFVDGEASDELSGKYPWGESVTLTAPTINEKTFHYWTNGAGDVIGYDSTLSLTMYAHTTVNAVYGTPAETARSGAAFTSITRDENSIVFCGIGYAPSGGTVTKAGVFWSTTASTLSALQSDGTDEVTEADGNCWMLAVTPESESTAYHAVAYAVVEGQTFYSDVKTVRLSEMENGVSLIASLGDVTVPTSISAGLCAVTFEANGGEGAMAPQGFVNGRAEALNANTFTREGYAFSGWSTSENGSVAYTDGQSVTLSADTTLYAQWKSAGSTVTPGGTEDAPAEEDDDCPLANFTDLDETKWYHDGVHWALENGVMAGVGDRKFEPSSPATRAMIAQILWNMEGQPVVNYVLEYSDVVNEKWYTKAVRWAASEGVMSGYGNGLFGTEDNVTREQLVTILYNNAKVQGMDVSVGEDTNILDYDDAFEVSDWAVSAMQWAVGSGLVTGRTATTLNPKDSASRAEIATIVMRYFLAAEE